MISVLHVKMSDRCVNVSMQPSNPFSPSTFAAMYVDPDDTFDRSSFNTPLNFSGSFTLPNQVFTDELLNLSSDKSQALAANIQPKVFDL